MLMKLSTVALARRWKRAVANRQHDLADHLAFRVKCNAIWGE